MRKLIIIAIFVLGVSVNLSFAQWGNFGNKIKNQVENKTQDKIQQEIDNAYDKSYDKSKEGVTGKGKENNSGNNSSNSGNNSNNSGNQNQPTGAGQSGNKLTATSKFDFIAGEKVLVIEDFMQDQIGDFPAKWNTNSSAEIVTLSGRPGRWMQLSDKGAFFPEFITQLPENFTLEFDLACSQPFSFYSTDIAVVFAQMAKPSTDFATWGKYSKGSEGLIFELHPQDAGNQPIGQAAFKLIQSKAQAMSNTVSHSSFTQKANPVSHIAIWRQKERIRIYVDQEKVFDLPKIYDPRFNRILFYIGTYSNATDKYYISNIKLAVGAPDTRSKLMTEGKFSTSGILFDVNSDKIKVESHGTIKMIADILNENPEVKIKVIGHTDSDGDAAKNLELSKKRALSVKNYLVSVFGIQGNRIETDGKGASEPVDTNSTKEGKANNRRVEFVKL